VGAAEVSPLDAYDDEDLAGVVVAGALMLGAAVVAFVSLIVITVGAAAIAGDIYQWWQQNRRK
jgi:hypothetical protein